MFSFSEFTKGISGTDEGKSLLSSFVFSEFSEGITDVDEDEFSFNYAEFSKEIVGRDNSSCDILETESIIFDKTALHSANKSTSLPA